MLNLRRLGPAVPGIRGRNCLRQCLIDRCQNRSKELKMFIGCIGLACDAHRGGRLEENKVAVSGISQIDTPEIQADSITQFCDNGLKSLVFSKPLNTRNLLADALWCSRHAVNYRLVTRIGRPKERLFVNVGDPKFGKAAVLVTPIDKLGHVERAAGPIDRIDLVPVIWPVDLDEPTPGLRCGGSYENRILKASPLEGLLKILRVRFNME
jgi:hypothetical protein